MTRMEIQLPDELYLRAKAFAAARGMTLDEVTKRGMELLLTGLADEKRLQQEWEMPKVHSGGAQVPLEDLHGIAAEDEEMRGVGD